MADTYKVSKGVILRKLLNHKAIERLIYEEKIKELNKQFMSYSEKKAKSGGHFFYTRLAYLGDSYLSLIFERYYQGKINQDRASEYLDIKAKSFVGLEEAYFRKEVSHFYPPSDKEALFMTSKLFTVKNGHFQHVVEKSKQLKGGFCADPFLVASAKIKQAILITEETKKPNGSKIPNICEYFKIPCFNLEGFMERENWEF